MFEQRLGPADAMATQPGRRWYRRWWGIALIVIAVFTVLGALIDNGDSDSEAAGEPAPPDVAEEGEPVPETDIDGEEPTDRGESTESGAPPESEPEPEPEPDPDPEPESEEEPEPADDPAFEAVRIEGRGDDVIDVPVVEDLPLVATLTHDGSRNFAVISYDDTAARLDLMVNTIGPYGGTVPYNFDGSPAELEISADGAWSVTIDALTQQPVLTTELEGRGDAVVQVHASGRMRAAHDGERNFAVLAWGARRELLVNDIGDYDGVVRLPDALALEVVADGSWTLRLE